MGPGPSFDRSRKSSTGSPEHLNDDMYDTSWFEAIKNSYVFVWCDGAIGKRKNIDDDKNTLSQLAHVVNQHQQLVHTFNEIGACQEFISHLNNVCLITSGAMGQEMVPKIHNQEQIHSIYIFCLNKEKHELWASSYKKVRGVFTDIESICDSIQSTIASRSVSNYDRFEFDVIAQTQDPTTENQQELVLIYSKLSQIILYRMGSADRGRQEMIQYCRSTYTDGFQVQLINDFDRNYSKHHPFWWYTRDHFLQGILNRALNRHDLYALCCMYRFVSDLNAQLVQLQNSASSSGRDPLVLYFSKIVPMENVERLRGNIGSLLAINQFVSANSEQGIGMMLLKQQKPEKNLQDKARVLFKITIDRTSPSIVAYGNIGAISQFVHEKEYLISMGSVYRINMVEKLPDMPSVYVVKMTLINQTDLQYSRLTQCIQREQWEEEVNLPELGANLIQKFHLFKSANELFKRAFGSQRKEFRYIMLHYNMAVILACMTEHDKALEEYRYALTLARHYIPNGYSQDDLCLVPLYSQMALTYQQENRFTYAIEHAFRALGIVSKLLDQCQFTKELTAACYHTLGLIHDQEGKFSDARKFYEQALSIRQAYLPLGHTDITVLQRSITLLTDKTSYYEAL